MPSEHSSLAAQFGGSHYKHRGIQPVQFWANRGWDAFSGSILKYITRWRDKGGIVDLEKALHFAQMRMELCGGIEILPYGDIISMSRFIKANDIPSPEDAILYALEAWVDMGRDGNYDNHHYRQFGTLLTMHIDHMRVTYVA